MNKKLRVPLMKQSYKDSCGPACLEMIYAYYCIERTEDDILNKWTTPERRANGLKIDQMAWDAFNANDMQIKLYTSHHGVQKEELNSHKHQIILQKPNVRTIEDSIDLDVPAIILTYSKFLHPKTEKGPKHFQIITGYENDNFIFNNPTDGKEVVKNKDETIVAINENLRYADYYMLRIIHSA